MRLAKKNYFLAYSVFVYDNVAKPQVTRHEIDLKLILHYYKPLEKKFVFGEIVLEMKVEEVSTLLDLKMKGENQVEVNKQIEVKDRKDSTFFDVKKVAANVEKNSIKSAFDFELANKQNDLNRIASLILMYLFCCFLFPKSTSSIS